MRCIGDGERWDSEEVISGRKENAPKRYCSITNDLGKLPNAFGSMTGEANLIWPKQKTLLNQQNKTID